VANGTSSPLEQKATAPLRRTDELTGELENGLRQAPAAADSGKRAGAAPETPRALSGSEGEA
jgi:hypothetical protein